MYIQPLKTADPPIIPSSRLSSFLHDVYHNYLELLHLHRRLLERLHEIQRDEHPMIRSITAPIMDAALNWREAYTEYVPNYPISHYRIDDEMQTNPDFKAFADVCPLRLMIIRSHDVDVLSGYPKTSRFSKIRYEEFRSSSCGKIGALRASTGIHLEGNSPKPRGSRSNPSRPGSAKSVTQRD